MRCFLTIAAVFLFQIVSIQSQELITLEKLWKDYSYYAQSVPGFRFMNDGKHFTRLRNNTIKKYDLTTGDFIEDILSGEAIAAQEGFDGSINNYSFNSDESKIIIMSKTESIYRRSSKAYVYIYDIASKSLTSIYDGKKIMYPSLSPDDKHLAFVWKNNCLLYTSPSPRDA